jgi:hypothetical protein
VSGIAIFFAGRSESEKRNLTSLTKMRDYPRSGRVAPFSQTVIFPSESYRHKTNLHICSIAQVRNRHNQGMPLKVGPYRGFSASF